MGWARLCYFVDRRHFGGFARCLDVEGFVKKFDSIFTMGWKCALWASPRLIIQLQVSPNFGPSPWLIIFGSAWSTDISYASQKRALQRRNKWPNRPSHTATLYMFCCGLWPIRCRRGSKTNKSNCQVWNKFIYYWLLR